MPGMWDLGTVELTLAAEHFSSLIIAVHSATQFAPEPVDAQPDPVVDPASGPRRGAYAEIADYDRHFARARFGLDHRPIAAVTIVHTQFIVDVTFDVIGNVASALFVDANDETSLRSTAPTTRGAAIMACRTADALDLCGLHPKLARRALRPRTGWI